MRLKRSKRSLVAVIPTARMADIAFLLIIFFMVTTAFSLDRTPLELPETAQQEQTAKGAAIISITEDGTFRFSEGTEDARPVDGIGGLAEAIDQHGQLFPAGDTQRLAHLLEESFDRPPLRQLPPALAHYLSSRRRSSVAHQYIQAFA